MNYFLMKYVYARPDGWLWFAPQYHVAMFIAAGVILVIAIITLIISVNNGRRSARVEMKLDILISLAGLTKCPSCRQQALTTIQKCANPNCRSVRVLKESWPLMAFQNTHSH